MLNIWVAHWANHDVIPQNTLPVMMKKDPYGIL